MALIAPALKTHYIYIYILYIYIYIEREREGAFYIIYHRSPNGYFKPLLDPGGGFTSKTAVRWFQKRNGRYETVSELKRLKMHSGYVQQPWPLAVR
jgi:hypothetical protein